MDSIIDFVKGLDVFASPLTFNFEDGLVTVNKLGRFGARDHRLALGDSISPVKNKLVIGIRNKISKHALNG